jgi:8-oxo-dGTP diphosphatase
MGLEVMKHRDLNPHVSVDCVIFGFDNVDLNVLLIEREEGYIEENANSNAKPARGALALPGDHIREDEKLDQAAARVLKELTNLDNIFLEQFHAFGHPNRVKNEADRKWMKNIRAEPDARVITVAYYSLVRLDMYNPTASSFAKHAAWFPVSSIAELAFDHNLIVNRALESLRNQLKNEPIGFELLPPKFTLSQLRRLYELILGTELEKRNFRRKILKKDFLVPLDEKQKGVPHKAARLFTFDKDKYETFKTDKYDFSI